MEQGFSSATWMTYRQAKELVAELGAALICADLGIKLQDREDHSAFIASWLKAIKALKALKDDKRAIFRAAAHAQRALGYIHSLQDP